MAIDEDMRKKGREMYKEIAEIAEKGEQTSLPFEETEEEVEEDEEETKHRDSIQDRVGFYNFCRSNRKPVVGQLKQIKFPKMEKDEDTGDYIKRAEKATGVKISSVGVMKKPKRNASCPCKSGKKSKNCCYRG